MKYPKTFGVFVVFLLTLPSTKGNQTFFANTQTFFNSSHSTNVTNVSKIQASLLFSTAAQTTSAQTTSPAKKQTTPEKKESGKQKKKRDVEVAYYTTAFIACGVIIGVVVVIGVGGYFFYQSTLHQAQAMDQEGKDTDSQRKDTDSEDGVEEESDQTESEEDDSDDQGTMSNPSLPTITAPQTATNPASSTTQNSSNSGIVFEGSAPISSTAPNFAPPVTVFEPPASAPVSNFTGFPGANAPALPDANVAIGANVALPGAGVEVSTGTDILSAATEFSEDDESDSDDDMQIIEDIPESPLVDASKTTGWTASGEGSGRFNFDNGGSIL